MNLVVQAELHVLMECPTTWRERMEYLDVVLDCNWDYAMLVCFADY